MIAHYAFTSKIQSGKKGEPEDTVYGITSSRSLMVGSIKSMCSSFVQNLYWKPTNKIIGRTSDGKSLMKSQEGRIFLPVRYHWNGIIELEVPPNETLGFNIGWPWLHLHNTNIIQNLYSKPLYPPDTSNTGQKKPIRSKRVWPVLPDSTLSQWGSLIDASSLLQSLWAPVSCNESAGSTPGFVRYEQYNDPLKKGLLTLLVQKSESTLSFL